MRKRIRFDLDRGWTNPLGFKITHLSRPGQIDRMDLPMTGALWRITSK